MLCDRKTTKALKIYHDIEIYLFLRESIIFLLYLHHVVNYYCRQKISVKILIDLNVTAILADILFLIRMYHLNVPYRPFYNMIALY
jgi:hypothetical protein